MPHLCPLLAVCVVIAAVPPAAAEEAVPAATGYAARIESLRVEGLYAEARMVAASWRAQLQQQGVTDYRLFDAQQAARTMQTIAALPPEQQRQLAAVDRARPALPRLSWGLDTITPILAATEQVHVRRRILGTEHLEVWSSAVELGTAYHRAGMYAQAEEILRRAVDRDRMALPPDHPDRAMALVRLGVLLKDLGPARHAEARRCQEKALQVLGLSHAEDDVRYAPVWNALGHLERRAGHAAAAESLLQRALALDRRHHGDGHPDVANDLLWLGWFHLRNGRLDEAQRCLATSRDVFAAADLPERAGMARNYLATVDVLQGDMDGAARVVLQDWRGTTSVQQRPGLGLTRASGNRGARAADILLTHGRPQAAWESFVASSGWSARLFTCLADIEERQRRLALIDARRSVLDADAGTTPGDDDDALFLLLEQTAAWLAREQEAMRACAGRPGEVGVLRDIQRGLEADQAIVGWVLATWSPYGGKRRDATWAYVIRRTGPVHWEHLATHEDVATSRQWNHGRERLRRLIHRASVWPQRVDADADLAAREQEVGATWFEPLRPHLDGVERLLVVFDDSNRLPPLECLRDAEGVALLDRYVISYIPSASVVAAWTQPPKSRPDPAERRALVIGDPSFDPLQDTEVPTQPDLDDMRLVHNATVDLLTLRYALNGDAATLRSLPRLPYSQHEARRVAACFRDPTLWLGRQPTETQVSEATRSSGARSYDYIHLATHALLDAGAPERSAIVLSPPLRPVGKRNDGLLTMREIYLGWDLEAVLVTLSGCQTGQLSANAGGFFGISQAFLRAGARTLLVSQWKVDDIATALLMGRFYENLTGRTATAAAPMDPARALAEAKRWLRRRADAGGRRPFAHPAYWAGFVLVGDPR